MRSLHTRAVDRTADAEDRIDGADEQTGNRACEGPEGTGSEVELVTIRPRDMRGILSDPTCRPRDMRGANEIEGEILSLQKRLCRGPVDQWNFSSSAARLPGCEAEFAVENAAGR